MLVGRTHDGTPEMLKIAKVTTRNKYRDIFVDVEEVEA